MNMGLLLPAIEGLDLVDVRCENGQILVEARTTCSAAICPSCEQKTERVHSFYGRTIQDLPWSGCPVTINLRVRRFFCDNANCKRLVFCERLAPHIASYGRHTDRQRKLLQMLAVAMGGEMTARLLPKLGLSGIPAMLLNAIRAMASPESQAVRVVGVDDWAKRKGHVYGTILIDLEASQIVDLLEDRSTESFAAWLAEHPEVEIISRDRFVNYSQAATQAAPNAVQIADLFHLLKNLTEAIQRMLDALPAALRNAVELVQQQLLAVSEPVAAQAGGNSGMTESARKEKGKTGQAKASQRTVKHFEKVKQLQQQGLSQRAIARETGLHRRTVRRYVLHDEAPVRVATVQPSTVTPYFAHVKKRLAEGCTTYAALHAELIALGYKGSYTSVRRAVLFLSSVSDCGPRPANRTTPVRPLSARQAARLLVRLSDKLAPEETQLRDALCSSSAQVATVHELAQTFCRIVRQHRADDFDTWLTSARNSGVTELHNFADSLVRDYAAVKAALTLPWSNGPVDGHVNKLKVLKRQMYGRANLDLLHLRLVHAQ
ncbi:MAG: ISL3 family transposase [Caldilinea sp.]